MRGIPICLFKSLGNSKRFTVKWKKNVLIKYNNKVKIKK
jgi:hypothetical protein